jgi:hypothetical protein
VAQKLRRMTFPWRSAESTFSPFRFKSTKWGAPLSSPTHSIFLGLLLEISNSPKDRAIIRITTPEIVRKAILDFLVIFLVYLSTASNNKIFFFTFLAERRG